MDSLELAIQVYLQENFADIAEYSNKLKADDDPLAFCIKKDLYEKLSKDAKDVIELVLDSSMETFTSITSPNNIKCFYAPKKKDTPSLKLLERYLRWVWKWKGTRIYKTVKEIQIFLNNI